MKKSFGKKLSKESMETIHGGISGACVAFYGGMFGAFTSAFIPVVGIILSGASLAYGVSNAGACSASRR
jgi:hypothetical protein